VLFLIASAPDSQQFKRAFKLAKDLYADVCLMQNAVYASRHLNDNSVYILHDDMNLRGISQSEISGNLIDYNKLVDLMAESDKVVGIF
jgi:sulfur relay protein TusB/DsrH